MDKPLVVDGGEWSSSKKVVNHKTRQVETRIKRQLIMEDGKVIADSGPQVTIRTKEDNWTEESENSAKKGLPVDLETIKSLGKSMSSPSIPVNGKDKDLVISEKIETKNTTREDKHERFQYHDESISELTGFEIHQKALVTPNDLITINCDTVNVGKDVNIDQFSFENDLPPKGKLTHYSSKSHKVTDKEEVKETSKLGPDGEITKETVRTSHHEEVSDDEEPEGKEEKIITNEKIENKIPEKSKQSPPPPPSSSSSPSSRKIIDTENSLNPVTSLPSKSKHQHLTHHRHLDDPTIYDISGKADHTNKWIESHFGSSDSTSSQHGNHHSNKESGLNSSSSNGSIVDRRGRPRQRINPILSQSYDDEAYYSNNTNGGNQSQSNNSSSKLTNITISDKAIDSSISLSSPSPSTLPIIGGSVRYQQNNQLTSKNNTNTNTTTTTTNNNNNNSNNTQKQTINTIGYTKWNETGNKSTTGSPYSNNNNNNNSTSESSISSCAHDYHHSSEGSLSPSVLTNYPQHHLSKTRNNNNNQQQQQRKDSLINKRWSSSYQLTNSKPVNPIINSSQHNNSRNLIIKVKRRIPKEDASVQASLSDEETDREQLAKNTNYGKQSINLVNNGYKDVNNNNLNRSRPIKTYYFGETVESNFPAKNNQQQSKLIVDDDVNLYGYRLPVNGLLGSKLIQSNNQGYLIEQFNSPVNHDYNECETFSRSLNCLNDQRTINGSLDELFNPSSRTDLFQTRDYGSLSNWQSTITLQSSGLTRKGKQSIENRTKDDSFTRNYNQTNYRDLLLNRVTLRKGHLGSVNDIIAQQFTVDPIPEQKSRELSPIQERHSLALDNNLNLLLSRRANVSELNPINHLNNPNNPKGTYKVNCKHRTPIRTYYFKAN